MIFEFHKLTPPLNQFLESVFYFKDFKPDHSIERVVPTGHLFIIFELDGITRNTFDNKTLEPNATYSKAWISGMHKNYLSISAHQDSEMFVIQFKPYGASPFLHIPINELNDKVIPAQEIFGDEILGVRRNIIEQPSPDEKFKVADGWLNNRFNLKNAPDSELQDIANTLAINPLYDHKAIISQYPKTQKSLIDQFKKHCGYTPKVLHRVFRFNEILKKINNKETISWTRIAYECSYSDQSHFIKEFKEFSGFSPQEFIKRDFDKDEPNFFPLDREG